MISRLMVMPGRPEAIADVAHQQTAKWEAVGLCSQRAHFDSGDMKKKAGAIPEKS